MKRASSTLFLSLLMLLPLAAQSESGRYAVAGIVADSTTNEAIPAATVLLYKLPDAGEPSAALFTDEGGRFECPLPGAGNYELVVTFIGKKRLNVPFTADGDADLGVLLLADDIEALGEVTVAANVIRLEAGKVTYDVTADPASDGQTLSEMLRKVPMVSVDGEGNVSLAGSSNYKIYLNGQPNSMLSSNASEVLKSMPASSVKKIEVITNPGAKYDAEGVGGIINIVTTSTLVEGWNASVQASYRENNSWTASAYGAVKLGRFSLSGRYSATDYQLYPSKASTRLTYTDGVNGEVRNDYDEMNLGSKYHSATLESSFEIDSLNLLTVSGDYYTTKNHVDAVGRSAVLDVAGAELYGYDLGLLTDAGYGSGNLRLDYQHLSPKRAGEMLVVSYRFEATPTYEDYMTSMGSGSNYTYSDELRSSDGRSFENGFQVDYTLPFGRAGMLNVGGKYVHRINDSDNLGFTRITSDDAWEEDADVSSNTNHRQHVLGLYGEYALQVKRFGIQAGLRYEYTKQNITFDNLNDRKLAASFSDLVPSLTLSYAAGDNQNLSLSYNMRINRPGIYYLNPFRDSWFSPVYVTYGNPELETERYNVVSLNYNYFTPAFTIGATMTYTGSRNAITDYSFVDGDGILNTTYANIGIIHKPYLTVFSKWNPFASTTLNLNAGVGYSWLSTNSNNLVENTYTWSNEGVDYSVYMSFEQQLPWNLSLSGWGGTQIFDLSLYSVERCIVYYYGLSLRRKFLKGERMQISAIVNTFAPKYMKVYSTSQGMGYLNYISQDFRNLSFSISLSYKFGDYKTSVRKTAKSIENTDVVGDTKKQQ